jgi:CheY-like chemotaxis protein
MNTLLIVVDDDIDDITLVQDALGYIPSAPELKYFLNAEGLLKYFSENTGSPLPPCAIVLDIHLPGMNGIALLAALKKDPAFKHIPISMVTSSDLPHQREQCLEYGACYFFTKPLQLSEWAKIVDTIVIDLQCSE